MLHNSLIDLIKENLEVCIKNYKRYKDLLAEYGIENEKELYTSHSHLKGGEILPTRYLFGNLLSNDFDCVNIVYNMQGNMKKDKINKIVLNKRKSFLLLNSNRKDFLIQFYKVNENLKKIEEIFLEDLKKESRSIGLKKKDQEAMYDFIKKSVKLEGENLKEVIYNLRKKIKNSFCFKDKEKLFLEKLKYEKSGLYEDEYNKVLKTLKKVEEKLNKKNKSLLDFSYDSELIEEFKKRTFIPFKLYKINEESIDEIPIEIVEKRRIKKIKINENLPKEKQLIDVLYNPSYLFKPEVPFILIHYLGSVHLGAAHYNKYAIKRKLNYCLLTNLGIKEKIAQEMNFYGSETTHGLEIVEPNFLINTLLLSYYLKKTNKSFGQFVNEFLNKKYKRDLKNTLKIYSKKTNKYYEFEVPNPLSTKDLVTIIKPTY